MAITYDEYLKIIDGSDAKFYHTNLHIHTPATPWDWNSFENQTTRADEISPERFFDALNTTSLDLIAITDHNTVAWCEALMTLAQKAREEGRSKLYILPGVEITSYEGPHIIGIFNDDIQIIKEINAMLISFGLSGEGKQDDRVGLNRKKEYTLSDIVIEIESLGGIVIAPHVHNKMGLWGHRDFRGRYDVLLHKYVNILAAPSGEIKRVSDPSGNTRLLYKNMDTDQIKKSFAFINTSDCHRLEDFELDTTWMKMGKPTLEGIKQITYEPELRVSHEIKFSDEDVEHKEKFHFVEPPQINYPYIIGMTIRGGNLDSQIVRFSPHQNSIIGKNYAGKSAIVDMIRFALDEIPPTDTDEHVTLVKRLTGILTEGGCVNIYIKPLDNRIIALSRVLSTTYGNLDGRPDVFMLIDERFEKQTDLALEEVFRIETYPQGEVVKIKDRVSEQMRIIDALGKINEVISIIKNEETNGETTLLGKIVRNGEKILTLSERIEILIEDVRDIEDLENEIAELEKLIDAKVFEELKGWANIKGKLKSFIRSFNEILELSETTKEKTLTEMEDGAEIYSVMPKDFNPNEDSIDDFEKYITTVYQQALIQFANDLDEKFEALKNINEKLIDLEKIRQERYDQAASDIREIADDEAEDVHDVLVERFTNKQEKLAYLLERKEDLEKRQTEIEEAKKARSILIEEFGDIRREITNRRREIVELITGGLAENVTADLIEEGDYSDYFQLLEDIAKDITSRDNKIQNKNQQLQKVVQNIKPLQLVEIIRGNNANRLIDASGVTDNTARIFMSMGERNLHRLETCIVNDKFIILFKKEGDENFTAIDEGLSGGEQALALICVAMIPKEMPLVIDQPEDELGPALITHELVEQVRAIKSLRQLIFVTHVANIPVLGDSEQVVYIQQYIKDGMKFSVIECEGSLDDLKIVDKLLELDGGEGAFKKRADRYSPLLNI